MQIKEFIYTQSCEGCDFKSLHKQCFTQGCTLQGFLEFMVFISHLVYNCTLNQNKRMM